MSDAKLTAAEARQIFRYDQATGIMYRKHTHREKVGKARANGYLVVGARGVIYQVHQLAWLMMTGKWPALTIDHVNRIKTDNRWVNLRDVTKKVNSRNVARHPRPLVGPVLKNGVWYVLLPLFGEIKELGPFESHAEAHDVFSEEHEFAFSTEGKPRPRLLSV